MAYENNAFCWHGLSTSDTDRAKAFYPEVLGWKVQTAPMGDDTVTMFAAAEEPFCHVSTAGEEMPPCWHSFFRVADVDAAAKAAAANGGQVIAEPTDIPPGRFSTVASPSGAVFSLFHEADPTAENAPKGVEGGLAWTELWSQDIDADLAWLKASFGLSVETMEMPNGPYHILKNDSDMIGGAMPAQVAEIPSHWLVWFEVSDVDAAAKRTVQNGGTIHQGAFDVPGVGRLAVGADPTGAAFGIMTPAKSA